jgi:hypothetical protein
MAEEIQNPVITEPQPKANLTSREVQLSTQAPFISVPEKDITEEVTQSIQPTPDLTLEKVLEELQAGNTISFKSARGQDSKLHPGVPNIRQQQLDRIKNNVGGAKSKLVARIATHNAFIKRQEAGRIPDAPEIAFTNVKGDISVDHVNADFQDNARIYAEGRKALYDAIAPKISTGRKDIDTYVAQFFVDEFSTGRMGDVLATRMTESARGLLNLPGYVANAGVGLTNAIARSRKLGIPFSDAWTELQPERQATQEATMESVANIFKFAGIDSTAVITLQNRIKDRAKSDFENNVFSKDPTINKAIYEDLISQIGIDGSKVDRELISADVAYTAISEAMNQLGLVPQVAVLVAEGLAFGGAFAKSRNKRSIEEVKRLLRQAKAKNISINQPVEMIRKELMRDRKKDRFRTELLKLGDFNLGLQTQRKAATEEADRLVLQLDELAKTSGRESLDYQRLESKIINLRRSVRRSYTANVISPYFRDVIAGEITIATTGVAARNMLDGMFGMDADTAEIFGVLGGIGLEVTGGRTAITNPLFGLVGVARRGTASGAAKLSDTFVPGFRGARENLLSPLMAKLTQADTTVSDYERLYYMPRMGQRMPYAEKRKVAMAFRQIDKMKPEDRDILLNRLNEQDIIQEQLLSMFKRGAEREAARAMLSESFAETIGLPQAMAAYQSATRNADLKLHKKGGIQSMIESHRQAQRKLGRTEALFKKFEEHAMKFGNPRSLAASRELLQNTRKGMIEAQNMLDVEYNKLRENLTGMMRSVVEDPTVKLDDSFFENYTSAKQYLSKRTGAESQTVFDFEKVAVDIAIQRQATQEIEKALLRRFQFIKTVRNNKALHSKYTASALEAVVFHRNNALVEEMDAAYDGFRKFVADTSDQRPLIDLSGTVDYMLELAEETDKDIGAFFGSKSTFFSGYLGRKSRKMFERMVQRGINKLEPGEFDAMLQQLGTQGIDVEELTELYDTDPTSFGLLLHKSGYNIFRNANIEEAEEFRKAFRDYGRKTSNRAVAREYFEFEKVINKVMEDSDPEGYEFLEDTRDYYGQLNDPMRQGSPLARILNSDEGVKKSYDEGAYAHLYSNPKDAPYEVVSEIGKSITKIMGGGAGRETELNLITTKLGELSTLFGHPTVNGEIQIDLREPKGQLAVTLMKEAIEATVYDAWASEFLKKRPTVGNRIGDPRSLNFVQSVTDELQDLQERFVITVIDDVDVGTPERRIGAKVPYRVFDPEELILEENDIAEEIVRGGELYDEGVKLVRELEDLISAKEADLKTMNKKQEAVNAELNILANTNSPMDFYDKYISGTYDIDELRSKFINVMKSIPENKDTPLNEIQTMFDNAVISMTYQSLLQKGQFSSTSRTRKIQAPVGSLTEGTSYSPASAEEIVKEVDEFLEEYQVKPVKGLNGESIRVSTFANINALRQELYNEDVLINLEKVLPQKHIEQFTQIVDYLAEREINNLAGQVFASSKGISANEALSRAYNIARGMVSPLYVGTEATIRILNKMNQDSLLLALQSEDAAGIIVKLLKYPKLVTDADLNTFDTLIKGFLVDNVSRYGQEEVVKDYFKLYLEEEEEEDEG